MKEAASKFESKQFYEQRRVLNGTLSKVLELRREQDNEELGWYHKRTNQRVSYGLYLFAEWNALMDAVTQVETAPGNYFFERNLWSWKVFKFHANKGEVELLLEKFYDGGSMESGVLACAWCVVEVVRHMDINNA